MQLDPLLHLDLRLGEGSGAAVAVQVVRSALAAHAHMATLNRPPWQAGYDTCALHLMRHGAPLRRGLMLGHTDDPPSAMAAPPAANAPKALRWRA
jgi:hypothetical protein